MIQRIQTLWIVLAVVCMALCFAFPVANYTITPSPEQQVEATLCLVAADGGDMMAQLASGEPVVHFSQRLSGMPTWPLITLVVPIIAVAAVSIFLYRNRTVQVRIVSLAFLLNVGYAFLLFFWAVDRYADLFAMGFVPQRPEVTWAAGAFLPLAALVMLFLAQRAIRRDEARVRAADRLR